MKKYISGHGIDLKNIAKKLESSWEKYGFRKNKELVDPRDIKKILLLRLDEIGDVVLTSAFLREVRHCFPQAAITLVVKPETYNLVELCPYVDKVQTFNWRVNRQHLVEGCMTIVNFCQEKLWSEHFDLCIIPRYDHDMYNATLLAYLSGANMRVAYTEQSTPLKAQRNKYFDVLLTHIIPGGGVKHEVERNLDILRHLGCAVEESNLSLWTDERDEEFATQALEGNKELCIALSPGKEDNVRVWPIDRYIEVVNYLVKRYNARVLILGSAAEAEAGRRLKEALPQQVFDFSGSTTLRETVALLKQCHLYIGRDTGVMHMATAVGTPVVEICCHARSADPCYMYSPRRFAPWGVPAVVLQPEKTLTPCRDGCRYSQPHCILQITVEQVKAAVDRMLPQIPIYSPQVLMPKVKHIGGNNMRTLFIHPNFPAQFLNLAPALGRNPDNQVVFLTNRQEGNLPGVQKVLYAKAREVASQTHNYVRPLEDAVLQGQAACRAAIQLKQQGFVPDVVYAHSGWGPGMFMKEIFPKAAVVNYFEWFYHSHGTDADFDPSEPLSIDGECRIRAKNAPILIDVCSCDRGVSPTYFQRSQFPSELQSKISVLHDGVNSDFYQPKPDTKLVLPNINLDLSEAEEIVTYVGRGMEPYRGFPQFMESVEILLKRRPNCHVVIVGADRVAYGKALPDGKTYKQLMLEKLDIDLMRVHFTGLLPYNQYRQVLQASSAHVYLTRPFVLSWSMLEAMSTGCLLVASDTAPVREVIKDGENGLLVDFFSPPQIAARIEEALTNPDRMAVIRQKARQTILDNYALNKLLPQQIALLQQVIEQKR